MSHLQRDPGIIWRVEKNREAEVLSAMESGEETEDHGTVILVVSGTMHQLNYVGGAIWQLCDGTRSLDDVVDQLLTEFDVSREELNDDVKGFVDDLLERGWLSDE